MSVRAVSEFCRHLDKVIIEECDKEKVKTIINRSLADRQIAELTLREAIHARLQGEFASEFGQEVFKAAPLKTWEGLEETYLINKAFNSANETIEKLWQHQEIAQEGSAKTHKTKNLVHLISRLFS